MPGMTVAFERSITLAPRRNGNARADFHNAIASYDHHLIGEHRAGTRVEQPPGADGDQLVAWRVVLSCRLSVTL
jgi:hypothetical protein